MVFGRRARHCVFLEAMSTGTLSCTRFEGARESLRDAMGIHHALRYLVIGSATILGILSLGVEKHAQVVGGDSTRQTSAVAIVVAFIVSAVFVAAWLRLRNRRGRTVRNDPLTAI